MGLSESGISNNLDNSHLCETTNHERKKNLMGYPKLNPLFLFNHEQIC